METAIAIVEDGYQDTRFTAGGVVCDDNGKLFCPVDDKELKTLTKIKMISEEADEFLIQELSKDKLVYITACRLAVIGDSLYYIYEGNRMDDGKIEYILAEFPEEIAQPLLAQHNKN